MSAVYWRDGYPAPPVDAEVAHNALEAIRRETGGSLEADAIVDRAESTEHPLHPCFTWDDAKCGRLHRLNQARTLVRALVVEVREVPVAAYQFVTVSRNVDDSPRSAYVTVERALSDDVLREELVRKAAADVLAVARRYRYLQELGLVWVRRGKARRGMTARFDDKPTNSFRPTYPSAPAEIAS